MGTKMERSRVEFKRNYREDRGSTEAVISRPEFLSEFNFQIPLLLAFNGQPSLVSSS